MDVERHLDLALELADIADAITERRFRAADLVVETKPDLTPVSEADRAVEEAVRERLAVARRDHAVLGEEFGVQGAPDARYRWIVDPIDGTKNYVRGVPVWATLLALEVDGELSDAQLSFAWDTAERFHADRVGERMLDLAHRCWRTRGLGDFWQHMLVAEGAFDISIDPIVSLWDVAALVPIVEEAGGRWTTLGGERDAAGGSLVCTNARLHDEVLAAFA
jgi:histidinol-phosphatase